MEVLTIFFYSIMWVLVYGGVFMGAMGVFDYVLLHIYVDTVVGRHIHGG